MKPNSKSNEYCVFKGMIRQMISGDICNSHNTMKQYCFYHWWQSHKFYQYYYGLMPTFIFFFNFIFKLYIIVLVLPNIKMNPPQVYMCSPSWTLCKRNVKFQLELNVNEDTFFFPNSSSQISWTLFNGGHWTKLLAMLNFKKKRGGESKKCSYNI